LGEEFRNVLLHFTGVNSRTITLNHSPIGTDEELRKVPFYEFSQQASLLVLQVLPKRVSIITIHVDFTGQIPLGPVAFSKLLDFCLRPRLLTRKLITWKPQNAQTLTLSIFSMESCQLSVVDRGLASFGSDVHDDQNMTLVAGHALLLSIDVNVVEIVDG